MATPSLALIPSGYSYGKVYSVLPSNGDGDFTFDRDSNATRVNKDGLIEEVSVNVPRLDYSDGSCPSLLLEPSRTNLITYSKDLSNWTKLFGHTYLVTDNSTDVISPSGLNDASKVEFDNSSQGIALFPSLNGTYSGFVYVKGIAGETIRFNFGGQEQNYTLTGEWDKLERENLSLSVNAFNLNTFGGATARTIYVWGAQAEQGSYATSYIPTQGSVATRVAETCTDAGNADTFNSTEGVLYAEISKIELSSTSGAISISDSTTINRIVINGLASSLENRYNITFKVNNTDLYSQNVTLPFDSNGFTKLAIKWNSSSFSVVSNGQILYTENNNFSFQINTLNRIGFDSGTGVVNFYGKTKEVRVYKEALTDAELQELTS